MHPLDFFSPHLISLYTRRNQKVCIFFTIVLAMMFDGPFAIPQIHQEEQALEIKKQFLLEFSKLISPTIKQTPHKLCDAVRALTLPFSGVWLLASVFYFLSLFIFDIRDFTRWVFVATSFSRFKCSMNSLITKSILTSPFS